MANDVTKIGKKLDKTIADMKKLAPKFVKASGDKKEDILSQLKVLTKQRDDLKNELDKAVQQAEKSVKLKIENYVSTVLPMIIAEEAADTDVKMFAKQLAGEVEDELEDNEVESGDINEAIGFMTIVGYVLLSNTVALMLSKFAKKQAGKLGLDKTEAAAKRIEDWSHRNEVAFKAPIKRIVSLFTKNTKYQKVISDILYAILILFMAGQAGADVVSYVRKAAWFKSGFYAIKTFVKSAEVHHLIKDVIKDIAA